MKNIILAVTLLSSLSSYANISSTGKTVLRALIQSKATVNLQKKTVISRLGKETAKTKRIFNSYDMPLMGGIAKSKYTIHGKGLKEKDIVVNRFFFDDESNMILESLVHMNRTTLVSKPVMTTFTPSQFVVRSTVNNKIVLSGDNGVTTVEATITFLKNGTPKLQVNHINNFPNINGVKVKLRSAQELNIIKLSMSNNEEIIYSMGKGFRNAETGISIKDPKVINEYIQSLFR